ncbi:MAG TPA: hypothetical protein VLA25_06845, partial [Methylotenera sp.]|nr:hypothetical protein [Methylotenera sp.]
NMPPPRQYAPVSEAMFQNRLEDVIVGKSDARDFDEFLCDGQNTIVYVNGVKTTFASLYKSLASSSRQITGVDFTKVYQYNGGRRCIKELSVTHKAQNAPAAAY